MGEITALSGSIGQIDLDLVEREATPEPLMKLSIQLYLAVLSRPDTVSVLESFGVVQVRSTVHNLVHKADLQPEPGRDPDRVAVDETVIRINGEQFWLYAAVDPETNELLQITLEPTTTKVVAHSFLSELQEKHDVDDAAFLVDTSTSLRNACERNGLDLRYEIHENLNAVDRIFMEIKRRTNQFSNPFRHASAESAESWLHTLAFAWNKLI